MSTYLNVKFYPPFDFLSLLSTYSIWMDFMPGNAKHVVLALVNVNSLCDISIYADVPLGYNAYFVIQPMYK